MSADVTRNFPIKGYRGRSPTRAELRVHFLHRNIRDTMVILEYENLPYPLCPRCDILVP